jgi:hypothetical protein
MDSIVIPVVTLNMIGIGVIAAIALGTKQPRGMKKRYAGIDSYDIDGDPVEVIVKTGSQRAKIDDGNDDDAGIPSKRGTLVNPGQAPPAPIVVSDSELNFVYVVLVPESDGKCVIRRDTPGPDEDVPAVVKRVVSTTDGGTVFAPANLTISFLLAIPIAKASTILHDIGKQLVEQLCDETVTTWLHDPLESGATMMTPIGNIGLCIGMTRTSMVIQIRNSDAAGPRVPLASRMARDGVAELLRATIAKDDDEDVGFLFRFPCEWMQLSDARRMVEQVLKKLYNPEMLRLNVEVDVVDMIKVIHVLRVDQAIKDDGSLRAAMKHANTAAKQAGFDDDDEPDFVVFRSSTGTGCQIDAARAARLQTLDETPVTDFSTGQYGIIECAHEYVSTAKTGAVPKFKNKFVAAFMSDDGANWSCDMFIDPGPPPPPVAGPSKRKGAPAAGTPPGAPPSGASPSGASPSGASPSGTPPSGASPGAGKKKGKKGKTKGPAPAPP